MAAYGWALELAYTELRGLVADLLASLRNSWWSGQLAAQMRAVESSSATTTAWNSAFDAGDTLLHELDFPASVYPQELAAGFGGLVHVDMFRPLLGGHIIAGAGAITEYVDPESFTDLENLHHPFFSTHNEASLDNPVSVNLD